MKELGLDNSFLRRVIMFEVNGILYAGSTKELLKIQDVKVTGDKMLLLTFSSGEKKSL